MKINPVTVLFGNNPQSTPAKPIYRGLTADKFEKTVSFERRDHRQEAFYNTTDYRWESEALRAAIDGGANNQPSCYSCQPVKENEVKKTPSPDEDNG